MIEAYGQQEGERIFRRGPAATQDAERESLALEPVLGAGRRMVTQAGLEPATPCSGGRCSIQLSYWATRSAMRGLVGRTGLEPVTSAV